MPETVLFLSRAEILALAPISATDPLDRATADQAIRHTVRRHGGVRHCAAALAYEFGEHPEIICKRMSWAREVVANLYPSSARPSVADGFC
jgi:hypothetical protein